MLPATSNAKSPLVHMDEMASATGRVQQVATEEPILVVRCSQSRCRGVDICSTL